MKKVAIGMVLGVALCLCGFFLLGNKGPAESTPTPEPEQLTAQPQSEYSQNYDDLTAELLEQFQAIYLESLNQPDPEPYGMELSPYEVDNIPSAWENLGLRVPVNSEDLYKVWKFETYGSAHGQAAPVVKPVKEEVSADVEETPTEEFTKEPEAPAPTQQTTTNTNDDVPGTEKSDFAFDFSGLDTNTDEPIANEGGGKIELSPIEHYEYHDWISIGGVSVNGDDTDNETPEFDFSDLPDTGENPNNRGGGEKIIDEFPEGQFDYHDWISIGG